MKKIALLGAGGKMGVRLATNLQGSPYEVMHVEPTEAGRARLKEKTGLDCIDGDNALADADAVLMAVPDRLIGKIAHTFIEKV
ncbi:MAG: semialdehyde dehydrogenase, partial [Starkeya sp.]|nr:semialdehyde dehydrogenase [Starkeya sp.]